MARGSPFTGMCQALSRPVQLDRADLHLHSTFSDGLYEVGELASLGRRAGLAAMALTDHDTLAGWPGFAIAVEKAGVIPVCGVEITSSIQEKEVHILGLGVDPGCLNLVAALHRLSQSRLQRYRAMIDQLETQGIHGLDVHWDEASRQSLERPGLALGRRNLAEALVGMGKAPSIRIAFDRWLRQDPIGALEKARLPAAEAIDLIHQAGGIASWAHPQEKEFEGIFAALVESGLDGLEAEYPDFKNRRIQGLRKLARDSGLLVTGGSDCHGPGPRFPGSTSIGPEDWKELQFRLGGVHVSGSL